MGLFSGLPLVKTWFNANRPAWFKTHRDNFVAHEDKWKGIQTGADESETVTTSDKFITKRKLVQKLKK